MRSAERDQSPGGGGGDLLPRVPVQARKGADLPWTFGAHGGCGVEEGCCGECLRARSTEDVSPPTAIFMAKVTILGATGNVGVFAAHTVSEIPYVSDMLLVGRPGREDFLAGCCRDYPTRLPHAAPTSASPTAPVFLMRKTRTSSSAPQGGCPPAGRDRTGTTSPSRTQRSLPELPRRSAGYRPTPSSFSSQIPSTS